MMCTENENASNWGYHFEANVQANWNSLFEKFCAFFLYFYPYSDSKRFQGGRGNDHSMQVVFYCQ